MLELSDSTAVIAEGRNVLPARRTLRRAETWSHHRCRVTEECRLAPRLRRAPCSAGRVRHVSLPVGDAGSYTGARPNPGTIVVDRTAGEHAPPEVGRQAESPANPDNCYPAFLDRRGGIRGVEQAYMC